MFKKVVIVFVIGFLCIEGFYLFTDTNEEFTKEEIRVVESFDKIKEGYFLANGKLEAKQPVIVESIILPEDRVFVADIKVFFYQKIRREERDESSSRFEGYSFTDEFVESDSYEFEEQTQWESDDVENYNYESYPVSWKSQFVQGSDFVFREKFELDQEAMENALSMYSLYTSRMSSIVPNHLPERLEDLGLTLDSTALASNIVYYGENHLTPKIGDIKMQFSVFTTMSPLDSNVVNQFRFFGKKQGEMLTGVNSNYYLHPAFVNTDDQVLEKIVDRFYFIDMGNLFLWRMLFGLIGIILLIYFIVKKLKGLSRKS